MKKIIFAFAFLLSLNVANAQDVDSTSADTAAVDTSLLMDFVEAPPVLLPDRMIFTQRWIYGEKGLLRLSGLVPLTLENRQKEMKWRRGMLFTHQLVGYATLASMLGTAATGFLLYKHISPDIFTKDIHEGFVSFTNAGYIAGAALAFLAPPALISRSGGKWDSIDWHKMFAVFHITGMITTNILSEYANQGPTWKRAHAISGGLTALSFTAAFVSIKF